MPSDIDRKAFARVLVNDHEHSENAPVVRAMMNEVIGPDMVSMLGPSPDAGPIVQPQSPPLWLLLRYFQAFLPPEPFGSLVVNIPAFPSKQRCDPSIAVAAELCSQRDDSSNEPRLILRRLELAALR